MTQVSVNKLKPPTSCRYVCKNTLECMLERGVPNTWSTKFGIYGPLNNQESEPVPGTVV